MVLPQVIKILLVEDNPGDARLVKEAFAEMWQEKDYILSHVTTLSDGLDHVHNRPFDVILLDLNLPDSSGVNTFYSFLSMAKHIPVLLLTGVGFDETAQELVRAGAQDFLVKGNFNFQHLVRSVSFAIERNAIRQQLNAEQERVLALMENALDGILVTRPDGTILEANPSFCAMVGYSLSELKSMNAASLLDATKGNQNTTLINLPRDNRGLTYECWLQAKSKKPILVEMSSKNLYDGRVQSFARDVGDRKQNEANTSEIIARANYHDQNSPIAVIEYDSHKHITKWTGQAEKFFGWKEEEVLGKYHTDFKWVPDEEMEQVELAADMVMSGKYPFYTNTNHNLRKDGTKVTCDWYTSVLTNPSGEIISVRSYVIDATERENAANELRKSEKLFSALFYGSPLSITVRAADGRLLAHNEAWQTTFGLTDEEIEQEKTNPAVSLMLQNTESEYKDRLEMINKVFIHGEDLIIPEMHHHPGTDHAKWLSVVYWPILDANGKVDKVITLSQDISAIKNTHTDALQNSQELEKVVQERTAELRLANEELARAAKMKDEFLASMSHELRTPLTGILGLTEALALNVYGPINDQQRASLINIESSGRHLLNLISDILDLSKINASMLDLSFGPASLDNICESSMQMVRPQATKKQINMGYQPANRGIVLRSDQRRLKQAVMNLLNNAIKFTPNKGNIGIDTRVDEQAGTVEITVWDEGIGISPEDQTRLFQPFVQLDSSLARKASGTGLGLSLARKFAELHGGTIRLQSEPNKGSRFTIILPYIKQETEKQTNDYTLPGEIKMALIVEKNERNAVRLTDLLESIGLKSQVSLDAEGGLNLASRISPDIIFLRDAVLLSDPKWIQKLKRKEITKNIPLIFISQYSELEVGADGVLHEPFAQEQLHEQAMIAIEKTMLEKRSKAVSSIRKVTPVLRQPVVFLTDDDPSSVQLISDFLRQQNFKVLTFTSGQELLSMLEIETPDVLLLDIQMPGMNGFDVIRAIRSHYNIKVRNLPVLAITAMAMIGDQEQCIAAGANAYISKPLRLKDVADTLSLITR
jgi:PAS domain S-box-containing protein